MFVMSSSVLYAECLEVSTMIHILRYEAEEKHLPFCAWSARFTAIHYFRKQSFAVCLATTRLQHGSTIDRKYAYNWLLFEKDRDWHLQRPRCCSYENMLVDERAIPQLSSL